VVDVVGRLRRQTAVRLGRPLAAAAVVAAGFVLVAVVDPNVPGHYPTCPFLAVTGQYCPGCGGLRAAHALTQGDVAGAAGSNLLLVLALPVAVALWARWLAACAKGRPEAPFRWRNGLALPAVALVAAFWMARNLPWGASLAP
jgi:Protein of unknown function (DUF2752)